MIAINLLPEHLRPIKRTPLPYIAGIALLTLAILGMAFVYLQNQGEIGKANDQLAENKAALDNLKSIVDKSNALVDEKTKLAAKLETIQEIVNDRIIWSRQLHNLNRLAPPNLWFQGISVENKPFKERIPVEDPRTKKIKEKVVRIDRPVLRLEGYVISVDGETPTISPLTLATEEDDEFSRRFQLLTTAFADTTFETFPVRSFTLEYSIEFPKSVTEEATEAAVEEATMTEGEPEAVPDDAATPDATTPSDSATSPGDSTEVAAPAPPGDPEPANDETAPVADTPGNATESLDVAPPSDAPPVDDLSGDVAGPAPATEENPS
jgi:hypothetical protein